MRITVLLRAGGVLLGALGSGLGASWLALEPAEVVLAAVRRGGVPALDGVGFQDALAAVCAVVLAGSAWWLAGTTVVAVLAHVVRGAAPAGPTAVCLDRAALRGCPAVVRRLVSVALGATLTAGVGIGAAEAETRPTPATGSPVGLDALDELDGLSVPDRTTGGAPSRTVGRPPAESSSHTAAERGRPGVVEVQPGDSLWAIAERHLPRPASDEAVTVTWQRMHALNRSVLGPDPDLVHPGTRLVLPEAAIATVPGRDPATGPSHSSAPREEVR